MLAEVVRRFSSRVTIAKEPGGTAVNAGSVLSIIGLDVKRGEECLVRAQGVDSRAVIDALMHVIVQELAQADEAPEPPIASAAVANMGGRGHLPPGLRRIEVQHAAGRAVCAGVGIGVCLPVAGFALSKEAQEAKPGPVQSELASTKRAVMTVRGDLHRRADLAGGGMEAQLLRAHAEIADDPALWAEIEREVRAGKTAAQGIAAAAEVFARRLREAESASIRDRAVDVQDVSEQLLGCVQGDEGAAAHIELTRDSIVFADTLTANQLLKMDRRLLKGLVLGGIGATSHTVILARSLRIPTLITVPNANGLARAGDSVVVDGDGGFVVISITPAITRYYERERRTRERWTARMGPKAQRPAMTRDGVLLEVGANASTAEEVVAAASHGADGVGLLRTELLFLDRESAPTEEEQFEAYAAVVHAAAGKPVIIRTFDIGGDKPAAYLSMPREENPFLGVRGVRLYEQHAGLLQTQLRAILRASALEMKDGAGCVKVMAPMIATPAEAAWFREQVRAAQDCCRADAVPFDAAMPVGIMIEIPAAAMVMDQLCDEVDFFSIGTNDLCQYWMAVDRGNQAVANLYNPRQPSFVRLLSMIVNAAKSRGKWIGICGEMAGERLNLPLMVGLGVDEISVAPGAVLALKRAVQSANAATCGEILAAAAVCRDAGQIEELLRTRSHGPGDVERLLESEMIVVESDAADKHEAIKEAVDLLFIAGRTEAPRAVEEAVWAREATYSTGLGYGFAIPHCKTDAVTSPTLAVVRLTTAIDWGSMDGLPVSVVILLAVPAADATGAHMKVFAKLARRLMHEDFRARLTSAPHASAIETCLREELGIE